MAQSISSDIPNVKAHFEAGGQRFSSDLSRGKHLSIPLDFQGKQPNGFGVPPASSKPFEYAGKRCSIEDGRTFDCYEVNLLPHGNGTHTECVGHIVKQPIAISETLGTTLLPATLITVKPEIAGRSEDTYIPEAGTSDQIISQQSVKRALAQFDNSVFHRAMIVRTLPNDASKSARSYDDAKKVPYFSIEAMQYLVASDVEHLIVDLPSIDRLEDEGYLSNHHIFWNIPPETQTLVDEAHPPRQTITEFIYAPDEIKDGHYLVQIEVPHFLLDAAPSRVTLFEVVMEG